MAVRLEKTPAKRLNETRQYCGTCKKLNLTCYSFAQDGAEVEEIIVTGARGRPRTVTDSPVPVDVFSAADIEAISHTDTNNILQTLVPSFNVARQPISDGSGNNRRNLRL